MKEEESRTMRHILTWMILWAAAAVGLEAADPVTVAKSQDMWFQDEGTVAGWMIAVKRGDLASVRKHHAAGVDVNMRGKDGWTALMWCATLGRAELARWLISRGANLRAVNAEGSDALMLAALTHTRWRSSGAMSPEARMPSARA